MVCVILAAGYATRLYPLTEHFPKPLLEVGGKPILDWLIEDLEESGEIREYVVISNHKFAAQFSDWAADRKEKRGWNITVVDDSTETNETRLGAVKDIQFAMERLELDDDLLVLAGDNLLDFSLGSFLSYIKKKQASCVMRYFEPSEEKLKKCGVLSVGEDDRILSMVEKPESPPSHWCCPPFYFYAREDAKRVAEGIAAGCGTDAPGSFIAWLCQQSPVYAMEMPGSRYDIGNLESYEKVKREYRGICNI
ncbi:MAG: NDP-sugar synthase [Lachnospiraceae bacterium]